MNKVIHAQTLGDGWVQSVKYVLENGQIIKDGSEELRECIALRLIIEEPLKNDSIMSKYWRYDHPYFAKQRNMFDYQSRIKNYNESVNQMTRVIEMFRKKPETKSSTVITLIPERDISKIPCLIAVDFKMRELKVITQAFFRSQDVWNKQPFNLKLLTDLCSQITKEFGWLVGPIILDVCSAHIYMNDISEINALI